MTKTDSRVRQMLLRFALLPFAFHLTSAGAQAAPATSSQLVLTRARDTSELKALVRILEQNGARLPHLFPPDAALGQVPPALDPEAIPALAGRVQVVREASAAVLPSFAAAFARAGGVWRELQIGRPGGVGTPLTGDALPGDGEATASLVAPSAAIPGGCPVTVATSDYMLGDVAIGILFPESVSSDPAENSEDWTPSRQDQVVAEIVAGAGALAAAYPEAGLDFVYQVDRDLPTDVEPIAHSSGERNLWIGDAMTHLGFSNISAYIRALRERHGTDWTVAVLVVDSAADGDGMFTDGKFAFAYLGGPYQVLTWDNDGWGVGNMDTVFSHEFGHNFRALDEYTSAGNPCTARSGVLQVENQNSDVGGCLSDVRCLMRSDTIPTAYCAYSEGQVGLRDSDGNGIPDLRDAPPRSALDPLIPDPAPTGDVTLTGSATALPDAAETPWPAGHTLNEIGGVEYRLDGGPWLPAEATDGAFDELCEDFRVALTGLADGWHEVESAAAAWVCDPADVDICSPPRRIVEATWPRERFYVNSDCLEDPLEPNDRPGEERAIAGGTTAGLQLCAFDPDRFRLYLRAGATLAVRAEYTSPTAAVALDLYAPSGMLAAHGDGAAGIATVGLAAAGETGWHAIVFSGIDEAETAYSLVVTASCIDDPFEPNPDLATAPGVGPGSTPDLQICRGDDDWYRVSVSAGADLGVTLTHTAALGDLDLGLFRADLTPIALSETLGDVEMVSGALLPAGVYGVRVRGHTALDENRYQLDLVSNRCLDDLGENDDDRASARPGPGRFSGQICPGDEDWVRVDIARTALLRASLVFDPAAGEIELDVVDAGGVVVGHGAGGSGLRRLILSPLRAGSYWLRLHAVVPTNVGYVLDVAIEDPLTLYAVKHDADVVLDWNDVGVECFRLRRSDRKETYDGGFETLIDLAAGGGEVGQDPTGWIDRDRIPDGVLYFYDVEPAACSGAALSATKTVDKYPVYDPAMTVPLLYTINLRNDGREPVTSIRVTDDLPPGTLFSSVIEIPPGATDDSTPTGGRFNCGFINVHGFAIAPGESARVRFQLHAGGSTVSNARAPRNQARVTGLGGSGQLLDTLSDDPSTHAPLDSTDVLPTSRLLPLAITSMWNQDVDLDLRVIDPCGNALGPADLPTAECPRGTPSGTVGPSGGCGDPWPWGWLETVNWWPGGLPASGRYEVWLRYTASRDSDTGCRHGGLEDAVVLVETGRGFDYRWMVLDPDVPDWIPVMGFDIP